MYYVHSVFSNKCFQIINISQKETGLANSSKWVNNPNMTTNSICSKDGCQMHKVTKCNEFWCVILSRSTGSKLGMT